MSQAPRLLPLIPSILLLSGVAPGAHAQAPLASPTSAPPFFQVIRQQTVDVGNHRIIFNRVVPPAPRPIPTPAPIPAAVPEAQNRAATPKRVTRSASASTNSGEEDAEPRFLFLSATVYDGGQFTELRGSDAAGGWRAWSNVDFLLLAPVTGFGVGATTFTLNMGLGADTSDWLTQAGQYPAGVSSLPAGQAFYYFADGATAAAHPEAAAALDALHLYADANRPALLQARRQREAGQAVHEAQAEYARQHPTPPPDTIINFWPKQGSVFLGN